MYGKGHTEATDLDIASSNLSSISWSYFEFKKLQDSIKIRTQRLGLNWQKNISLLLQKGSTIMFVAFVDKNQLIEK